MSTINEILIPQTFEVPQDPRALAYKIHTLDSAIKTLKNYQDQCKDAAIKRAEAGEQLEGLIVRTQDKSRELTDLQGLMSEACMLVSDASKFMHSFQKFASITKEKFTTLFMLFGKDLSVSDRKRLAGNLYDKYCTEKPKKP